MRLDEIGTGRTRGVTIPRERAGQEGAGEGSAATARFAATALSAPAIGYTIVPCALGLLMVAASRTGICAVAMGEAAAPLADALRARFGAAEASPDDPALARAAAALAERVAMGVGEAPDRSLDPPPLDLPLDLRGTPFQQRVWAALRGIPAGRTTTYAAIATAIGAPGAVRAVAGACGANPLALIVPCHRVVRADGALSGYRWGVERKRRLLAGEGAPGFAQDGDAAARRTRAV